jgi:hypothetical protein
MNRTQLVSKLEQIGSMVQECLHSVRLSDLGETEIFAGQTAPALSGGSYPFDVDFSVPVRPFMKAIAHLSGAKKFTALLAWTVKGDLEKQVALAEIESEWNKMAGMLNLTFNRRLTSEAKEADWVESRNLGFYNLRPGWKRCLSGKE